MPRARVRKAPQREKKKTKVRYYDYSLLAVIIFLVCFGLVMLYSTSAYSALVNYGDSMYFFKRQIFFCVCGFGLMYVVSRVEYHKLAPYAKKVYWLSVILMALVQTPLGKEVNGARRWLRLPMDQQFQPAEVAKIAIIIFIPLLLCRMGKEVHSLRGMARVMIWGGFSAACVYILTDNLSTAIIVIGISCFLIFVVHPKTAPFVCGVAIVFILMVISIVILNQLVQDAASSGSFRLRRILVWLQPEQYASGAGYQVMQGLYAIGSGGFFGKGLGNGVQKMVIPEVQNDMILSIICEELGVFGAIIVLVLFGLLLYRLMFIAQNAPDMYGALIVTGIFAHISIQVILNVAVVINLIPTTGITLPFISYGGTSVLFLMAEMGLALSVARKIQFEE